MENLTPKEIEFIDEQKKTIIQALKNAGVPKEGASDFMDMLYGMMLGEAGNDVGLTDDMQSMLKTEWPAMKEEILKGYEN